jgi:outer membrane lipoprotein
MKKTLLIFAIISLMFSCAPVLQEHLLRDGIFNVSLPDLKQNPVANKGRLYILGGIIVNTKIVKNGSLLEAIYVPVTSKGYLKGLGISNGRFLALYRGKELLDPLIFREKREITLAGEFIGTRKGKIGDMDYTYPLFEIKEIHLWAEAREVEYYPYPYYMPPWYDRYGPYYPRYRYYPYGPRWYY